MWDLREVSTREEEHPYPSPVARLNSPGSSTQPTPRLGSPPGSSEPSPRFVPAVSHQQSPHYNGSSAISPNDSPRDAEQSVVQERMRKGLVISVLPDGPHGFLADLKFYLNNNHMLLWAFAAHPAHPYPPQRRRLVLLNSLAFCFFITSVLFLAVGRTAHVDGNDTWRFEKKLEQGAEGLRHLPLLRHWPTTLSVMLQLIWDVPGSLLGSCPCARSGMPTALRKPCGFGMLCCLACHLLGILYGVVGVLLLWLLGPGWSNAAVFEFLSLFVRSKTLAFLLALPASSGIFILLRCHEQCVKTEPGWHGRLAPGGAQGNGNSEARHSYAVDLSRQDSFVSSCGQAGDVESSAPPEPPPRGGHLYRMSELSARNREYRGGGNELL